MKKILVNHPERKYEADVDDEDYVNNTRANLRYLTCVQ
ncbi:MAG: hypothetical protein JWM21_567 [Acidobacteria bacterium]|nr:hypothetical protein [Acidobacteriota bacterium]